MNVYIFLSQRDDIFRTGFNAERTALAPIGIHDDGTFKFYQNRKRILYLRLFVRNLDLWEQELLYFYLDLLFIGVFLLLLIVMICLVSILLLVLLLFLLFRLF